MVDVKDFLAGLTAGVISLLVSHPFDTLKVRQQSFDSTLRAALMTTLKYEGVKGLYKGINFPLLTYGPSNSLFFGVYANVLRWMTPVNNSKLQEKVLDSEEQKRIFNAGCIAGVPQVIFYAPVDYIKIILQANTGLQTDNPWHQAYRVPYKGVIEAIKGIYKDHGIRGLYRGFWPMVIRDVPTSGLYVLTYEQMRSITLEKHVSSKMGKEIIAGGTAGVFSIGIALPIDVVKTSMQTDNPYNPMYKGMTDCMQKLYSKHGLGFFFTGMPVLCMRAFPAHAVMFTTYELIMEYL